MEYTATVLRRKRQRHRKKGEEGRDSDEGSRVKTEEGRDFMESLYMYCTA
jgi:hypothetical protein